MMKSFLILSIAIALITPICATTFLYAFKCKSNDDNSTMTHENRLQQFNAEGGVDTLGYLAGSFNHLQKGRIALRDMIGYYEGEKSDLGLPRHQGNAGFFHNMNLSFAGAKGISEFYAGCSFSDSGTISSNNAIRFEEFSRNSSQNFNNNLSINHSIEKINVNADAIMGKGRRRDFSYDFLYDAKVANGVVETKRTMILINKTDLGRVNLEQISLLKGNITLADHLSADNLLDGNSPKFDLDIEKLRWPLDNINHFG